MSHITIYHNADCGTSRNALALILNAGVEPRVIHYLQTPPSRDEFVALVSAMGIAVRDVLRQKGTPFDESPHRRDATWHTALPPLGACPRLVE
jgi:arsenate reductase (glutaredoxin)